MPFLIILAFIHESKQISRMVIINLKNSYERDKTMDEKLLHISNDVKQKYHVDQNQIEKIELMELTIHNSIKVPNVYGPTNERSCYKTLGTRFICQVQCPLPPCLSSTF